MGFGYSNNLRVRVIRAVEKGAGRTRDGSARRQCISRRRRNAQRCAMR
jgi:hypothetical protein